MNIKKNRIALPIGKSCDYCNIDWNIMNESEWETLYLDPEDNSIICGPCHKEYSSAGSKEEPNA